MSTIADRVRELIDRCGLSRRTFAAQVELDESKLSKSLSGARRFSSLELAQIAEFVGVSTDWLITGDEPMPATAARTNGGSAECAIRQAKRLRTLRSDMAFLGYRQPWRPLETPQAGGSVVDQGERLANQALTRVRGTDWTVTDPDLPRLIELVFGADVAVVDLDDDFDGLAISSDEVKLILVAESQVPARQRFTLAHELGHLLAGDDQELHVDEDVYRASRRNDPSETRANVFAAAFLMEERTLRDAATPSGFTIESFATLACDLRVSPSALAYRLCNLGLIGSEDRERFRTMPGAEAARIAGRIEDFADSVTAARTPRLPGLLVRDTYAAYSTGAATLRPYADLIGADVHTLRENLESESESVCTK